MEINEDTLLNVCNSAGDRLEKKTDSLKKENSSLKENIVDLQDSIKAHSNKLDETFNEISNRSNHSNSDQGRFKKLTEKVTDLEDRSCRNNLRFDGFLEQDNVDGLENSENRLEKFVAEDLAIGGEVIIERTHRLEKPWKMMNGI